MRANSLAAALAVLVGCGATATFGQSASGDAPQSVPAMPDRNMMSPDMMGQMMSPRMMGGMMGGDMMQPGMMAHMSMGGPMRGQMMKIMFAVADTDGDGALSFTEVEAVHKRIFDVIDANKDGKVTLDEMQEFMQ
jgi:hypothetical protein